MRLAEFLDSTVVDADGHRVGPVDDVRLVQDGPRLEGFGAALRVEGLIVGAGSLAVRVGYHRHRVQGPALLKLVFTALERRARYVAWDEVVRDGRAVVLGGPASAVPRVSDVD